MKKKLMMVAVLLGALTLGACVDDNESQSVTDVRNAKAEQLKSIAAMNNAEAQAKITLANADAALKIAEAAQKQALADKAAAEAKIAELKAKMAEAAYDANLAAQLTQAEAAKKAAEFWLAESQGKIDKLVVTLQTDLATLQIALLQAQLDLKDKEGVVADAQLKEMKDLANRYATVLSAYALKSQAVISKKATIAGIEAELKDWEVLKASDISAKEFSISIFEKQIAALKEYSNYAENVTELKLKLQDANSTLAVVTDKYAALNSTYRKIDINALKKAKNVSALKTAVQENVLYEMRYNNYIQRVPFGSYVPVTVDWKGDVIEKDDLLYPIGDPEFLTVEFEYKDVRELKLKVDERIAEIDVKGQKEAISKADEGLQAVYDAAVKATATAKAAYDAAPADAAKKTAYETALGTEKNAESVLNTAKDNLVDSEDAVAELNVAYTLVTDAKKGDELMVVVNAYNEAITAVYTEASGAYFAMMEASVVKDDARIAYNTIYAMVNGSGNGESYPIINLWDLYMGIITDGILGDNVSFSDSWNYGNFNSDVLMNTYIQFYASGSDIMGSATIDTEIKRLEGEIEKAKDAIAVLKDTTSKEQGLEEEKATAAGLQAQADVLQVKVAALKVRLDAAIAAQK